MKNQLQRIKSKDYTDIDDRLYASINTSSNIETTISTLTQLQAYLKNQISKVQNESEKETLLKASQVLFRRGQMPCCDCRQKCSMLANEVKVLKRYFKVSKQAIMREIKGCVGEVQVDMEEISLSMKKKQQKIVLELQNIKRQNKNYLQQIQILKQQNQKLKRDCEEWEMAKKRRRSRVSSIDEFFYDNQLSQASVLPCQSTDLGMKETPRLPRPLRERSLQRNISSSKKQNEENILKLKGAEVSRKSTKKLKLFSLLG